MRTGAHLRVQDFGSAVQGVTLYGDPKRPEPDEFRVTFPGGDVSITRCSDGDYWAHIRVNHPDRLGHPDERPARIVDGRVDLIDRHASDTSCGDLDKPTAYHVAVRVRVGA